MNDFINGIFEFGGAFMCWLHVRQIRHDRQCRGVAWAPFVFFASWGWWNALYFYPSVNCWWSWAGGVALVIVNTIYVALMWKYRNN